MKFLKTLLGFAMLAVLTWVACFVIMCILGWIRFEGYFVPKSKAIAALEVQGFRDIKIQSSSCMFVGMKGGGKDDDIRFVVDSTNPIGKRVTVYVFAGWPFKGATVCSP